MTTIVHIPKHNGACWNYSGSFQFKTYPCENTDMYIALEKNEVVGVLQVYRARGHRYGKTVQSQMTMVSPKWKKKGIAKLLWEHMIYNQRPSYIKVRTVTNKGYTLVESLQKKFPGIKWIHTPNPRLRSLKKKR